MTTTREAGTKDAATKKAESSDAKSSDSKTSGASTSRASSKRRTASKAPRLRSDAAAIPATIVEGIRNLLSRPLASYHLVLTMAALMTSFGLIMVLSASSVEGYSADGSAYGLFANQVIFVVLGAVVV